MSMVSVRNGRLSFLGYYKQYLHFSFDSFSNVARYDFIALSDSGQLSNISNNS